MFCLSETDLSRSILGCADGPAAFNSELTQRGGQIISVDPLYQFSRAEIRQRIEATAATVMAQIYQHRDDFVWQAIASPDMLRQIRMAAMEAFLADLETGQTAGRYLNAGLPQLPFQDSRFDLALCSHFLFLYAAQYDTNFHQTAIEEMLRVASEVRIFPVLELGNRPSRHLKPVIDTLNNQGRQARLETVAYEFQKGGNQMLVVF